MTNAEIHARMLQDSGRICGAPCNGNSIESRGGKILDRPVETTRERQTLSDNPGFFGVQAVRWHIGAMT